MIAKQETNTNGGDMEIVFDTIKDGKMEIITQPEVSSCITQGHNRNLDFGAKFSREQIDIIKKTICKNATDLELQYFLSVCAQSGLNPFLKQVYAVKRGDTLTTQISIDGLRLIAEKTGCYAPGPKPYFEYDEKTGALLSATATVKKRVAGEWHEVQATAFFDEFCQRMSNGRPTQFWERMPKTMLAKVAESQALRKAFPAQLSGLYSDDEMQQAENISHAITKPKEIIEKIGPMERDTLEDLLIGDDEFKAKILTYFRIMSLADLPRSKYDATLKRCLERNAERKHGPEGYEPAEKVATDVGATSEV